MKKRKIIVIVLVAILALTVALCTIPKLIHYSLIQTANKHAHETADEVITNEEYVIKKKVYDEDVTWITFYVEDKDGNVLFTADERWRAWDFGGIDFIDDTNNICVSSGDVGDTTYTFNGETWISDTDE